MTFRRLALVSAIIIAALFELNLSRFASALSPGDVVVSISPSEQDINLISGAEYKGSIRVSNSGRLPIDITVQAAPYYVKDNTYDPDFSSKSVFAQLSRWITLPQTDFSIEPGESVTVPYVITVPDTAVGGGQYAAILIRAEGKTDTADDDAVKVSSQLAAILRGHIDGADMILSGELTDHSLPQFMFNRDLSVSQTVKNTGNTDFKVTQTLTVRNFFTGHEVISPNAVDSNGYPIATSVATVLPDTSRTGILTWDGAPALGIFRVEQTISFLDQSYFFQRIVIFCPLWLLFILIVVIFTFIFSIFAHFKRKNSAKSAPIR